MPRDKKKISKRESRTLDKKPVQRLKKEWVRIELLKVKALGIRMRVRIKSNRY